LVLAATLVAMLTVSASAQSIAPDAPTPVLTNEIAGRIAPLDIGDARLTRFFYTFNGLQGDLELTVESYNLDGDIDIFLAGNLRPLTKVTLYAGASPTRASKTVYLRRDEPLILRVQARTPNDAEGTYRVTFGGAFRPAERLAGNDAAPAVEPTPANPAPSPSNARSADRKVRRVTSTGARIEEPVVAAAVEEEPAGVVESPASPPVAAKKTPVRPGPARSRSGTRANSRAQTARRSSPDTATGGETEKGVASKAEESRNETGAADAGAEEKPAKPKPERARPVRVPRARNNRSTNTARRTDAPPAEVVPANPAETPVPPAPLASGPRLVLVMRDGETFERDMSGVRRVTVENGMIVIVSKNGKTERQPMAAVLRMSIEP
jgi:hypothetical protein